MKGIIINQDTDGILKGFKYQIPTFEDIVNFPKEFEGSQVTDYFIAVCSEIVTFRSPKFTSVLDKYYRKEENGSAVDYKEVAPAKGAQYIWETLDTDYISV